MTFLTPESRHSWQNRLNYQSPRWPHSYGRGSHYRWATACRRSQRQVTVLSPMHVDEMQVSSMSVMPDGLLKPFTLKETRDLLTYLFSSDTAIPREDAGTPRPAPRSVAEVNAILSGAPFPGHYSWMFDDLLFRCCCSAASPGQPRNQSTVSTISSGPMRTSPDRNRS